MPDRGENIVLVLQDYEFQMLVHYIRDNFGINLDQKKVLVEGRLSLHIHEAGFGSYSEYLEHVFSDKSGAEVSNLITRLTTNHTFFMREEMHFQFLRQRILPEISRNSTERDIRIWSAGCSSGEEPYTIAMTLYDHLGFNRDLWDKKILATDISTKALEQARQGKYMATALEKLPPHWLSRYFRRVSDSEYAVADDLRGEVIFRSLNLIQDTFPFKKKFHVIFCRNVMIYFDKKTRNELIQRFYDVTEPGGYLFIGHTESIDRDDTPYGYLQPAIYQKPF
jgi:chemotaxis protein methyltransferase CheR